MKEVKNKQKSSQGQRKKLYGEGNTKIWLMLKGKEDISWELENSKTKEAENKRKHPA